MIQMANNLFAFHGIPALSALRAFFRSHDWSAASLSSPSDRSPDKISDMEYVRRLLDEQFEKTARTKGQKSSSRYYANDSSLMLLRDNVEDLIADGVTNLDDDTINGIFSHFDLNDPELEKKSDAFLKTAVDTMLDVMDYRAVSGVMNENSLPEDFNKDVSSNYRRIDAGRRIDHTREKTHAEAHPDPDANRKLGLTTVDVEKTTEYRVMMSEFFSSLDETEKQIFKLYSRGYTQKEIAERLGYSGNSGISKRIVRIKEKLAEAYRKYR